MSYTTTGKIRHIFVSPGHNYWGKRFGKPGPHPTHDLAEVELHANMGIVGDRFYNRKPDYNGQITFFAAETLDYIQDVMALDALDPMGVRRNVITEGINLNQLMKTRFTLQGITFEGTGHCTPCKWMNVGVAEGGHKAMKGRGGIRARILTNGILRVGDAVLQSDEAQDPTTITDMRPIRRLPK